MIKTIKALKIKQYMNNKSTQNISFHLFVFKCDYFPPNPFMQLTLSYPRVRKRIGQDIVEILICFGTSC